MHMCGGGAQPPCPARCASLHQAATPSGATMAVAYQPFGVTAQAPRHPALAAARDVQGGAGQGHERKQAGGPVAIGGAG